MLLIKRSEFYESMKAAVVKQAAKANEDKELCYCSYVLKHKFIHFDKTHEFDFLFYFCYLITEYLNLAPFVMS